MVRNIDPPSFPNRRTVPVQTVELSHGAIGDLGCTPSYSGDVWAECGLDQCDDLRESGAFPSICGVDRIPHLPLVDQRELDQPSIVLAPALRMSDGFEERLVVGGVWHREQAVTHARHGSHRASSQRGA